MKRRHELLQKIEGEYEYPAQFPSYCSIAQFLNNTPSNKIEFKDGVCYINNQRAGKFLNKCGFDNDSVAKFLENYRPGKFKISCRFKDIVNATKSKHMEGHSCYYPGGSNDHVVNHLLEDETVAVYLMRDKAGHIQARGWIRLVKFYRGDNTYYYVYNSYGNGLNKQIVINNINSRFADSAVGARSGDFIPLKRVGYYDDYFYR